MGRFKDLLVSDLHSRDGGCSVLLVEAVPVDGKRDADTDSALASFFF